MWNYQGVYQMQINAVLGLELGIPWIIRLDTTTTEKIKKYLQAGGIKRL